MMKYSMGVDAAIKYLKKKQEEKDNLRELALIPWVIGILATFSIFCFLFYGY